MIASGAYLQDVDGSRVRWKAVFPGIEVTSSILQCKFPPFSAKSVHPSVNLPQLPHREGHQALNQDVLPGYNWQLLSILRRPSPKTGEALSPVQASIAEYTRRRTRSF